MTGRQQQVKTSVAERLIDKSLINCLTLYRHLCVCVEGSSFLFRRTLINAVIETRMYKVAIKWKKDGAQRALDIPRTNSVCLIGHWYCRGITIIARSFGAITSNSLIICHALMLLSVFVYLPTRADGGVYCSRAHTRQCQHILYFVFSVMCLCCWCLVSLRVSSCRECCWSRLLDCVQGCGTRLDVWIQIYLAKKKVIDWKGQF